ncbi:50S ribosomal protein L18 [Candidatus Riesia pthiripubis]|uniref:Large ribosomal subunit protein uL18 n=1 Tax=Candidatus Riesia pthiripubis TaxID=428412 RepID=A0A1V0HP77_9ENTR|nr:50S ribosomal protein L18 [Candidatus Riesia pthiripubis]
MNKNLSRIKRSLRSKKKFKKLNRACLVVHRTSRHIYAQITILNGSKTLVSASTTSKKMKLSLKYTGNKEAAKIIGALIAKKSIDIGITKISFDRSGFKYHGRIKALAESARKSGLKF